jgi:hypothetical protein
MKMHSRNPRQQRRTAVLVLLVILAGLATAGVIAQSGGGYDLSWNTVDGGGGTSTGGDYDLSGTIGQSDAGTMSGGTYSLEGGFWPGATCVAPQATAILSGTAVQFAWSSGSYDIYRAVDDPYFASGTEIATGATSPYDYGESLLGDPAQNAYYAVGSSIGCGRRLGEFDFALEAGT